MTINVQAFLASLPMMAQGMGGIFVVIALIYAIVALLRRAFPKKGESETK